MSNKEISALLVFFCSVSCYGAGGFRVPVNLGDGEKGEYIAPSLYEIASVSINKDTFDSIKEKLGNSPIRAGHHTESHMCYLIGEAKIDFVKSSLGYGYEVVNNQVDVSKCGKASVKLQNGAGLEIGLPKSIVINILGEPSKSTEESLFYTYWIQEIPSEDDQASVRRISGWSNTDEIWRDVYSTITVKLKNGVVDGFSVYTSESY